MSKLIFAPDIWRIGSRCYNLSRCERATTATLYGGFSVEENSSCLGSAQRRLIIQHGLWDAGITQPFSRANCNRTSNAHCAPDVYRDPNPDSAAHQYADGHPDQHTRTDRYRDTSTTHGHAGPSAADQHTPTSAAYRNVYAPATSSASGQRNALGGIYRAYG